MTSDDNRLRMRRIQHQNTREFDITSVAYILADEYVDYQSAMDNWAPIEPSRFASMLLRMFSVEDIDFLMHIDLGRGILMGVVAGMCALEDSLQEHVSQLGEDPEEQEIEAVVLRGTFGYNKGGSDSGSEQQ